MILIINGFFQKKNVIVLLLGLVFFAENFTLFMESTIKLLDIVYYTVKTIERCSLSLTL